MTMMQLVTKSCLVETKQRLLGNPNELLRKKNGERKTVVVKSIGTLLKSVATRSIGTAVCVTRAILEQRYRKLSGLDCFSNDQRGNWIKVVKQVP